MEELSGLADIEGLLCFLFLRFGTDQISSETIDCKSVLLKSLKNLSACLLMKTNVVLPSLFSMQNQVVNNRHAGR